MARKPRFILPGVPQHIIQWGNNREPCFYAVEDYARYLHDLSEAAKKNHAAILAYVLMTNHVHLLVTPGAPYSIMHMMQDLGRKYVHYINHTYQRTGTLWVGRYKASLVDSEAYLLTCMRYIELNPVRANMVAQPSEYQWSSYAAYATGKTYPLIEPHSLYQSLAGTAKAWHDAYRELFRNHLNAEQVHLTREALNQELVIGRDDFKLKIEQMTQWQTNPKPLGRPRVEEERGIYYIM